MPTTSNLTLLAFDAVIECSSPTTSTASTLTDNDDISTILSSEPEPEAEAEQKHVAFGTCSTTVRPPLHRVPTPYVAHQPAKHVTFGACPSPGLPPLVRVPTPYVRQQPEHKREHIVFTKEGLCYGAPKPRRLQRVPTPPPSVYRSKYFQPPPQLDITTSASSRVSHTNNYPPPARHAHSHWTIKLPNRHFSFRLHQHPNEKEPPTTTHPHHHLTPSLLCTTLRARLSAELAALKAAIKGYQNSTSREWEEEKEVEEEVRRLLEEDAFWFEGRQRVW